jgi:hypothetical protein
MIFGETVGARKQRVCRWHHWFAWYPVKLLDGRVAWLETVERRESDVWPAWYYMEKSE